MSDKARIIVIPGTQKKKKKKDHGNTLKITENAKEVEGG